MSTNLGGPGELPLVACSVPAQVFENAVRSFGIVAACEWFGYASDSEFTAETIKVLRERSEIEA